MLIGRLVCRVVGHKPFIKDYLPDATVVRGCPRCGTYVRYGTRVDLTPLQARPSLRLVKKEQAR